MPPEDMEKPPLGLMPKYIWEEQRFNDVRDAVYRYIYAGKEIPVEWVEEYNELVVKCNSRKKER